MHTDWLALSQDILHVTQFIPKSPGFDDSRPNGGRCAIKADTNQALSEHEIVSDECSGEHVVTELSFGTPIFTVSSSQLRSFCQFETWNGKTVGIWRPKYEGILGTHHLTGMG